jgi:hypothetical protein
VVGGLGGVVVLLSTLSLPIELRLSWAVTIVTNLDHICYNQRDSSLKKNITEYFQ